MHTVILIRMEDNTVQVFLDGRPVSLARSLRVRKHSPTGFNAGYGGSGPAQAALGILLMLMPKEQALRSYQDFKFKYLARSKYLEVGKHEFTFSVDDIDKAGEQ